MDAARAIASLKTIGRKGVGAPAMMLAMLGMLMLPLPPFILDVLFSFNIALSLIILLAVLGIMRPLEFAAFPTVVLGATLLRLALNIASTRVVLLHGHNGPGAAGKVIEAFGEFVIGGNFAVGLVVFAILTIINFVVVTKGATRVSEVTARFTLDAMPGKQMAIDADLNSGLINRDQARERRREVREESDFYGSMDGASKFVRGDATAGILILLINIVGGFFVGVMQHGLSAGEAAKTYTLLTIGDGLVAQIPSLMLSIATAVIVTRVSSSTDMSKQLLTQVFGQPRALTVAGVVLAVMGLIPGMPNLAFLLLGAACIASGYLVAKRRREAEEEAAARAAAAKQAPSAPQVNNLELGWEDVKQVDPVGLELGYRLIPLVDDKRGGELLKRVKAVRRRLSQEAGFLVPPVHIRDNLDLGPNFYRITLMGVTVGETEIQPERLLAIDPGQAGRPLDGIPTTDPAFGQKAVWIDPAKRDTAQALGYTIVDPTNVIATHLSHILQTHISELLSHNDVQQLLDRLEKVSPKLVEDLVPKKLTVGVVCKVLQNLLAEGVPLTNLRAIVETLAETAVKSQDPVALTAEVRVALGRQIVQDVAGPGDDIPVITLKPDLEQVLSESLSKGSVTSASVEPQLTERLLRSISNIGMAQEGRGEPTILLVNSMIRPWFARLTRALAQNVHVLAYSEVPNTRKVRIVQTLSR